VSENPDRRISQRAECQQINRLIRATLTRPGAATEGLYLYLVDLSQGGLRVNSDQPFPEDVPVELHFGLDAFSPDPESPGAAFQAQVRRVWHKPLLGGTWVTGLALVDPSEQTQQLVGNLLQSFSPEARRTRFRLRRPIEVALRTNAESAWLNALTLDLSPTSLTVRIYQELAAGDPVDVMILLGDAYPRLQGPAQVVRAEQVKPKRYQAELRLHEWPAEHVQVLLGYIDDPSQH
jgi:hypothetical protein